MREALCGPDELGTVRIWSMPLTSGWVSVLVTSCKMAGSIGDASIELCETL